jgi:glutamate dehydrogenase
MSRNFAFYRSIAMKTLKQIAKKSGLTEEQLGEIEKHILEKGLYTPKAVREEIDWFCTRLGMNEYYFQTTSLKTMANHIEALKAAEIMASLQKEKILEIDLGTERKNEAIYLVDDTHVRAREVESRIEKKYPHHRVHSYRTLGKARGIEHLRMYFVYKPRCNMRMKTEETELKKIACGSFLKSSTPETLQRYRDILTRSKDWETPLIQTTCTRNKKELRIMIVVDRESSDLFFSNISDVINSHGFVSNRKYIEQFANGKTVYSIYLDAICEEKILGNLIEDISLVYVIPKSPLSALFREGKLTAQETVFGVSAWSFAHQFLTEYNEEYLKLAEVLKESPELVGILRNMKTRLAKDTFNETRIWETLVNHYRILKKAFRLFDKKFNPMRKGHDIQTARQKLEKIILQRIAGDIEQHIFQAVLLFIDITLRTNFYKREKNSLAFMYAPEYLNKVEYPETPFGIFQVIAQEFRGFHIRFRDISRGGIRIVRSNNFQNYLNNSDFIFDENYNLALTQQKKNKDIPEGGSKGTILLGWGYQDKGETAFKKYVNGLLDLLLPDESIVDNYGKEVILFLGPDEGTADLMAWASERAKTLDYPYWKSFSTGKPVERGGIPHDLYGMTTNSIHQYVLKIIERMGLTEAKVTKVMTGGPDGDLGSNEILISKDKILAIIDGSGVLYDPKGIDRKELENLARQRETIDHFRKSLLSPKGFLVTVKERNVMLPDGEQVSSGLEFRNTFHFQPRFAAVLFVPCGGRPASININNWTEVLDKSGKPRFKFIVEGANLFISQEARLRLEENGVIIYKDASANKGGVTSSSMEVFASLALSDEEYEKLMCVKGGRVSPFRKRYIEEIIDLIKKNASLEFEVIWNESQQKGIPRSILSDKVSDKINQITDAVYSSELYKNEDLFRNVIECCCPSSLIEKIGFENVLKRVPGTYLRAIFASRLASQYVYMYGLEANELNFYSFLKNHQRRESPIRE